MLSMRSVASALWRIAYEEACMSHAPARVHDLDGRWYWMPCQPIVFRQALTTCTLTPHRSYCILQYQVGYPKERIADQ